MITKHFTELEDRKVSTIQRGGLYYYCHPKCGDFYRDWFPLEDDDRWIRPNSQAYLLVALTGVIFASPNETLFRKRPKPHVPWMNEKSPGFWSKTLFGRPEWNFATDAGLEYRSWEGNFMLDKNALLREGIEVNLSPLDLIEPH